MYAPEPDVLEYPSRASVRAWYVCSSSQRCPPAAAGPGSPRVTHRITGIPTESPNVSSLVQVTDGSEEPSR